MKIKFAILFFFVNLTVGFSQTNFDAFDLAPIVLKEGHVKSITEYDSYENKMQYAVYDTMGNQVFYQSEDEGIIKYNLDYNEKGEIQNEQALGFEHSIILEKRVLLSETGKIDEIYYTLPINIITTGFIERYTYNDFGFVEQIVVVNLDDDEPIFLHNFSYNNTNSLEHINSYVITGRRDTLKLFTKEFNYYKRGGLKSVLQTTEKGDTIVSISYNKGGLLEQEIISEYYVSPNPHFYSQEIFEFLKEFDTPLNVRIIAHNIYHEKTRYKRSFIYMFHTYEKGKLMSTVKKGNNAQILETVQYVYDTNNHLIEQIKINYQGDTTTYQYNNAVLSDGVTESIVNLQQHSKSHLIITRNSFPSGNNYELKIELLEQQWEHKTISKFDRTTNSVIKEQFYMDDISTGLYPSTPDETIIIFFDKNGQQIRYTTMVEYNGEKVTGSILYFYSPAGQLEKHETVGWFGSQYWKYEYDPLNSRVHKIEIFPDSLYTAPVMYYAYEYDGVGNYSVTLIKVDDESKNDNPGKIQYFDSAGKLVKVVSWLWASWDDDPESLGPIHSVSYIYNEQGFCVEIISEEQDMREVTRYEYEFY